MYKAKIYIEPKGIIDIGEFEKPDEAINLASMLATTINKYSITRANPIVEKIKTEPEWEFIEDDLRRFKCSNCKEISFGKTKYCPHCGIKMNL